MRRSRGFVIVSGLFGQDAALFRFLLTSKRARQHVVEPERSKRACHPPGSDAYLVVRRPVNSTVRPMICATSLTLGDRRRFFWLLDSYKWTIPFPAPGVLRWQKNIPILRAG